MVSPRIQKVNTTEEVGTGNRPSDDWFSQVEKELADIELILKSLARNETIRCTECNLIDTSNTLAGISALSVCECPAGNY